MPQRHLTASVGADITRAIRVIQATLHAATFTVDVRILSNVYDEMKSFFSRSPIESGGILGIKNGILCRFFADGSTSSEEYRPNICVLNRVIAGWWQEGIAFAGIAHSHPNGVLQLSREDLSYAETIMAANPQIAALYFAVAAQRNGAWRLVLYDCSEDRVSRKGRKDRFLARRLGLVPI